MNKNRYIPLRPFGKTPPNESEADHERRKALAAYRQMLKNIMDK